MPGAPPPSQYPSVYRLVEGQPNLSQIGLLPDPAANRMLFIQPDGTWAYLTPGAGVTIAGTTLTASVPDGNKGDITVTGSGATWTINNNAVTFAKMQAVSPSILLGNDASGTTVQEITLGTNLSMTGSTLNAASSVTDGDKGDITVSSSGAVWTIDNNVILGGTYTPTLTGIANVSASTPYQCNYMRVRNMVNVSGRVDIDPTLPATFTQLQVTLPIASNFVAPENCAGTAASFNVFGYSAAIVADAASDTAYIQFQSDAGAANAGFLFTFMYILQ